MNPAVVMAKLAAMATNRQIEIQDILIRLGKSAPRFSAQVLHDMGLSEE